MPLARIGESLRDPDGTIVVTNDRVIRAIAPHAATAIAEMIAHDAISELMRTGWLVNTKRLEPDSFPNGFAPTDTLYEHERIPFISYACEWSPAMLAAAARFTLELCLKLLPHGLMLKDATPANVLFRGAKPVFVDLPSIVPRTKGKFLWLARDQFERCFLLPLIANVESGVPLAWLLQDTYHGIPHARVARLLGVRRWLKPFLARTVALPAALTHSGSRASAAEPVLKNDAQAIFTLERSLRSLLSRVENLAARIDNERSMWKRYTATRSHYAANDLDGKRQFVAECLAVTKPQWTLDIGANTGEFARMATAGGNVVALDFDESSVSSIFQQARAEQLNILPLVNNFARPTPALGWANGETRSLLQRCSGAFDMVFMLAVVHHLRITEGIPLAEILRVVHGITRRHLIIEHVPPSDPMFRQLARGRDSLYQDCAAPEFSRLLTQWFEIERQDTLQNGRTLYLATRRNITSA